MASSQPPPSWRVVQACSVEPLQGGAIPSSTIPTSLPLTFFDLFWLRFPPVERLFFYHFSHSTSSFFDSVLPNLKHSLSLTLQHFLPLAGNIIWDQQPHDNDPSKSKPIIISYVPGDAVSFTVAESNADFSYLCSDLCQASQGHHLIPHLTTSHEKASVLALQVTLFPNSGFCIGLTTHHAAFDGKSSTSFVKSWAYTCSNLEKQSSSSSSSSLSSFLPEDLTPFFDRLVIQEKDHTGIGEAYLDAWLKKDGPNNRSLKVWQSITTTTQTNDKVKLKGVFELTSSDIQKLKQYALSKLKMKDDRLSTFAVSCAYVLACAVKAEQPKGDTVMFAFSVDCRSRLLDPPIVSPTYFGNCITGQRFEAKIKSLQEKEGFIRALEKMNEALSRVKYDGVLSGAKDRAASMLQKLPQGRVYSIAGSPRFEVYGIDFGWGRPKKVDITSIDRTGAFSLSESKNNNGGIEIGLVLNKHDMEAFSASFIQQLESF
ncbi:malonyl-CoA:anthocyanidin 5-O-glucoside-6''-O-malonyltransferase-like [Lotus japonicus]|uniref:malonyl-CoA:anthocyanidin 5-O-glucoside-6''-O-malonyltransferase-like n=1 Tax=Lotus japonicus TaxID=34305 RepID=UPI00258F5E13|nr:malonyl-CoA:anthocyanidin 5-O-glucoside-6''-O-malonyltransferase-like [Lotus japonicus]